MLPFFRAISESDCSRSIFTSSSSFLLCNLVSLCSLSSPHFPFPEIDTAKAGWGGPVLTERNVRTRFFSIWHSYFFFFPIAIFYHFRVSKGHSSLVAKPREMEQSIFHAFSSFPRSSRSLAKHLSHPFSFRSLGPNINASLCLQLGSALSHSFTASISRLALFLHGL